MINPCFRNIATRLPEILQKSRCERMNSYHDSIIELLATNASGKTGENDCKHRIFIRPLNDGSFLE
jgi:hypothetical protein